MPWQLKTEVIEPLPSEEGALQSVVSNLLDGASAVPVHSIIEEIAMVTTNLPRRLRVEFERFRLRGACHAVCVRVGKLLGSIDKPTPLSYQAPGETEWVDKYDLLHLVFARLLGDVISWSTIQNGYVFNDVMPIRENIHQASSSGYAHTFGLHTEDAFHRWAGDYLGLLCLRNPTSTPTLLAGFNCQELNEETRRVLSEERFVVGANVAQDVPQVTRVSPILFGHPDDPYFRINANATTVRPGDEEARRALKRFLELLVQNTHEVIFQPGDFWYIDNLKVAHGRAAYGPKFLGEDRWLRRLYITSALRYTRRLRSTSDSRRMDPALEVWGTFP